MGKTNAIKEKQRNTAIHLLTHGSERGGRKRKTGSQTDGENIGIDRERVKESEKETDLLRFRVPVLSLRHFGSFLDP